MNDVILLVGHGSRNVEGNREIALFATEWQRRNPEWVIETCFIEFADVLLDEGLDNAAAKANIKSGASSNARVIVLPLILNAAGHVKMEIPAHVAKARARHPSVEFVSAKHLGAGNEILQILKRELRSAMTTIDMPDPKNTGVILLGRGSSDKVANGEVAKMARWLFEDSTHDWVDIAFTGITSPRIESAVQRQVAQGMTQIVILPYYLFNGTLIERIKRQHQHLQQQYPQIRFALGNYFGFADEIYKLMSQRVRDVVKNSGSALTMMECDGCQYRELAEEQGHGHVHDHHHEPDQHQHKHEVLA